MWAHHIELSGVFVGMHRPGTFHLGLKIPASRGRKLFFLPNWLKDPKVLRLE